jgi:hypothetical protein
MASQLVGSCEHGTEPPHSMKGKELLVEWLLASQGLFSITDNIMSFGISVEYVYSVWVSVFELQNFSHRDLCPVVSPK